MPKGFLAFVLHAHLPYVLSHGRWPHGTDWLCEAAAETYLPLVKSLRELLDEGCKPKLTIGLSPVLCEQLADAEFKNEFVGYLNQKIDATRHDRTEFDKYGRKSMAANARRWEEFYEGNLRQFSDLDQDILHGFRGLQDAGAIEIITCAATHGYLPLLSRDESVQAQVKAAVANYTKHFGREPRGIWLPECAYRPGYRWTPPLPIDGRQESYERKGVEEFLAENGLEYFVVDSALLKGGQSTGVYFDRFEALKRLWTSFEKQYRPREEEFDKTPREVYLVASREKANPVAVFTRDPETGLLVWSGEHGYPGDGNYLEFHKKHFPGGLRYWAVTSAGTDLGRKEEYVPERAKERLEENSDHFADKVRDALALYHEDTNHQGILVAPFDAELFGHWWFEGPLFLKRVLKKICESDEFELTLLSEHVDRAKPSRVVSIPEGSWGQGNHHYIWLNEHTEWTWKHIYECEAWLCDLVRKWQNLPEKNSELGNLLQQLARELMLLSASDWQFLISTWAARDYAELRLTEHYEDFKRLAQMAEKMMEGGKIDPGEADFLDNCRIRDALFPELELDWFGRPDQPKGE
jgi:1,4-alpha-glucan branching enzyme